MGKTRSSGAPARRRVATVVVASALAAGVTACDAAYEEENAAARENATKSGLSWGDCPPSAPGVTRDPRLTCTTVEVPLNHRDPDGRKIEVAVSRLAATGDRRGVLVVNPGGPALPGLDTPGQWAAELPASIVDGYDLVGFDPRGVGHSTPQSCGLEVTDPSGFFPYPAADGSIDANVAAARATAGQCADKLGDDLRYFTTANTARDLDVIRGKLGEEKISYWGQSYGTYLGAVYGALHPDRTDRVVLEGNVDPGNVWAGEAARWGKGMADRFPDAAKVAAAQGVLGRTPDEVTDAYLALAERLDREPAPVPGTQASLNGAMLRNVTYALLLDNETLPVLAQVWQTATNIVDGTLTAADADVIKQVFAGTPPVPGVPADNQATMFLALTCGDAAWPHDVDDYAAKVGQDREKWPLTAGMPQNVWPCAFWPEPVEDPVTVDDKGPHNVMVLQNRRDHATPWESGVALREALGDRATLVGVDNGGHYVFGAGSACADEATVDFLSGGDLPRDDVECADVK